MKKFLIFLALASFTFTSCTKNNGSDANSTSANNDNHTTAVVSAKPAPDIRINSVFLAQGEMLSAMMELALPGVEQKLKTNPNPFPNTYSDYEGANKEYLMDLIKELYSPTVVAMIEKNKNFTDVNTPVGYYVAYNIAMATEPQLIDGVPSHHEAFSSIFGSEQMASEYATQEALMNYIVAITPYLN